MWLLENGVFLAATPRASVMTGGLNQVRVPGAVSASTPGISDSRTSHLPALKKSYDGGDSNPPAAARKIRDRKTPTNNNTTIPIARAIPSGVLRSNRPERRPVLVAWELAHYKVDIATLSESRFSEQCQLEYMGAGFTFFWSDRPKAERRDAGVAFAIRNTFFWSGRPKAERRDAGVAFAIRNEIAGRLHCLPQVINDRLMSLRIPLRGDKFTAFISTYAP
ncbi:unnamed protein product [Schistocephalus solidus]|uniref:Uncharacterized protein n=1 Tax=Schistocephalus solidus TaxID=70667 RepID=A0A183SHR2_SCHSO|nr:unnamed protein product [Schistocephalus solidus]